MAAQCWVQEDISALQVVQGPVGVAKSYTDGWVGLHGDAMTCGVIASIPEFEFVAYCSRLWLSVECLEWKNQMV